MEWFEKPYRFRHPIIVIKLAVVLFLFLSSRNAKAILYYVFRARISHKTICEWTQKFSLQLPAKKIFRMARRKIDREVTAVIHDGLRAYPRAVHWIFGRKCRSIVAGICGKSVIIQKAYYWFNNNMSESINAQIDAYLSKFHYSFENIDSANRAAEMFCTCRDLRAVCT